MIAALVRWVSLFATGFVVLSFLFFATNQTSTASQNQVNAIGGKAGVEAESETKVPNPSKQVEQLREQENDKFHEFVDDVDDVLTAPFNGIISSDSIWVLRLFPLACALIIYGLGGQYLARALGLKRY